MALERDALAKSPEALLVALSRRGDRTAFEELVRRRQVWLRNLLRRCCNDPALADDLAQQAFLQAWKHIPRLQHAERFGAWLKRIAVNGWLQHLRRNDPLTGAAEYADRTVARESPVSVAMDLDSALATLSRDVRLCIVLAYHERMTHEEIARVAGLPLGTIKSHVRRGTKRLQQLLSAYIDADAAEEKR